jgi:hypothetical protein
MHNKKLVLSFLVSFFLAPPSTFAVMSNQVGIGYGSQFLGNTDLQQFELFCRQPLPYSSAVADSWQLSTGMEWGAAWLREDGGDTSATARFSLMPQLFISPNEMVDFIVGLGAGFMVGETKIGDHTLGGSFLFASKLGLQLVLGQHWGLESVYYHQSNAGLYDANSSLNMFQLTLSYQF